MLRRLNSNEINIMQSKIQSFKFVKKHYTKLKEIYGNEFTFYDFEILDMLQYADNEFHGYNPKDNNYKFFKYLYPFNFCSDWLAYDEFYFNNICDKYNDFSSMYPLSTSKTYLGCDYEYYAEDEDGNSDYRDDGNDFFEIAIFSKEIDDYLNLFYDDKKKMRVLVNMTTQLAYNFSVNSGYYASSYPSFCIIKTDDYKGRDLLVDTCIENNINNNFLICILVEQSGYSMIDSEASLLNSDIGLDLYNYLKKEVSEYVGNNNKNN